MLICGKGERDPMGSTTEHLTEDGTVSAADEGRIETWRNKHQELRNNKEDEDKKQEPE